MPTIELGGVEIRPSKDGIACDPIEFADQDRTVSANLMKDFTAIRRRWSFRTTHLTKAQMETLRLLKESGRLLTFKTDEFPTDFVQQDLLTLNPGSHGRIESDTASVLYLHTAAANFALVTHASHSGGKATEWSTTNAYGEIVLPCAGLRWLGFKGTDRGIAVPTLDGVAQADTDLYAGSTQYQQALLTVTGLTLGYHTFKVAAKGTKNPSSSGYYVDIDAIDALSVYGPVLLLEGSRPISPIIAVQPLPSYYFYDLKGKIAGSTVVNPAVVYSGAAATELVPTDGGWAEVLQADYDKLRWVNGTSVSKSTSENTKYGMLLVKVDASSIAGGTNADVEAYLSEILLKAWCYGTAPGGNGATIKVWDFTGAAWSNAQTNTAGSPTETTITLSSTLGKYVGDANQIYLLVRATNASNGVTPSVIYLDYTRARLTHCWVKNPVLHNRYNNLAENPGFEEGATSPTSWTGSGTPAWERIQVRSGVLGAKVNASNYYYQDIYVEPGAYYAFAAHIKADTAGTYNDLLSVTWLDAAGATISSVDKDAVVLTTTHAKVEHTNQAPITAVKARIACSVNGSAYVYYDDVQFARVSGAGVAAPNWEPYGIVAHQEFALGTVDVPFILVAGDILVIDCQRNTVTRNGTDVSSYLTSTARFFSLLPGYNNILCSDHAASGHVYTVTTRVDYTCKVAILDMPDDRVHAGGSDQKHIARIVVEEA